MFVNEKVSPMYSGHQWVAFPVIRGIVQPNFWLLFVMFVAGTCRRWVVYS